MEKIEIELPEELKFMKEASNLDWSILVNNIIKNKLKEIEEMKKDLSKSELTKENVKELTNEINQEISKNYLEK